MRHLTVTIPDEFYDSFLNFLKTNPEISVTEKNDKVVPLWQQEIVLERIKNTKPEDYISWEDSKKRLDAKWLK